MQLQRGCWHWHRRLGSRPCLALLVLLLLTLAVLPPERAAAANGSDDPRQQLADRYAPIAYLRSQARACDRDGEGYFPAPVEVVLGNPAVALRRHAGEGETRDPIVMTAPTAVDLAGLDDSYYLDFPGQPRRPGCTYETDFKRFAAQADAQPTTYARIVVDAEAEQLVLQYWFWYYFNDWNNTHESDWEMIQLVFDATSVEEALAQEPAQIGYAQHGGGELAEWDDDKLGIEDGRPVVYPAAGSHATYYEREQFMGWGERGTGFGCDNASGPSRRQPLTAVLLPADDAIDPHGPFAWLTFEGRWGERQEWEFNGPTGPNVGRKWDDPLGAIENWRDSSLGIPASNTLGPTATDVFCDAVKAGSQLLMTLGNEPGLLIGLAVLVLGSVVALVWMQWGAVRSAAAVYRRHLRVFAGIGLVTIPIGVLFNGFSLLAREYPPGEWLNQWFNDTANARYFAAVTIGGVQQGAMTLVVAPPVIAAMRMLRDGVQPTVQTAFHEGYRRFWPLLLGCVLVYAATGLLVVLLVSLPLAVWLSVSWQFYGQAAVLDDVPTGRGTVYRSAAAVRGNWWQALGQALVFQLFLVLPGPLVGLLLLQQGKTGVQFANSLSSVIYAVSVPLAIIGLTSAYQRFQQAAAPPDGSRAMESVLSA